MDVGRVVAAVVGSIIAYIVATELIDGLVTGTSTGDTLISNVVPIVVAAGVDGAPPRSNPMVRTSQIRGSLSTSVYGDPELNGRTELLNCVETRRFASLRQDGGIVHSLVKAWGKMTSRNTQRIYQVA